MSIPSQSRGKSAWTTAIIIALIFTMPALALSLPPVTLPGIRALNVTSLQTPTYAESSIATVQDENNWTQWSLTSSPTSPSLTSSSSGLLLEGAFPASSGPSDFSITRSLDVNLTTYPLMYMLVKASSGVTYGIRFSSLSSGLTLPLWTDADALNHRPGTGQPENVQIDMPQLIELNTGKIFNTVRTVTVYVERGSSTQPTQVSLEIQRFEFLNFPLVAAQTLGSYHAVYVGLSHVQQNPGLILRSVQIQGQLNASIATDYVPYYIQGLSVFRSTAGTVTKVPTEISVTMTLTAQTGRLFTDNLPTETAAIVIVAASGILTQFITQNILLNYYSPTAQVASVSSIGNAVYVNDTFFFLLLPAAIILLIYGQIKRTRRARV